MQTWRRKAHVGCQTHRSSSCHYRESTLYTIVLNHTEPSKPARVMADITEPSIGLTKLALLLLYYRLFSPDPIVKFAILAGIVFICVCYTTLMFLFIFLSTDKTTKVNKTMAIINILTDTYILVLPIYSVLKLYLPRRRKIGLALIFATGAL